jgi:hypothetical protein
MPRQTHIFQIFVASPSDVAEERTILETVVTQLNQVWSTTLGITFELLKWETSVHPSFSSDPQEAINEQIAPDYDVFIGILWGRVGTPTPRAESGTIEEFERAYARFKSGENTPEIMLYFKDAPISPSKIDLKQMETLQSFRRSLSDKGGLYSVFEDQASFESSVRAHLSAIAQKFAAQLRNVAVVRTTVQHVADQPPSISTEEDDYGYIDYIETHESRQAEMIAAITAINEATVRVGELITQRTAEMQSGAPVDAKTARRFIKRAADDMNSYADSLKTHVAVLSTARQGAYAALSNALALQSDFAGGQEDLRTLRNTLRSLIDGTTTAREGMVGMRASTDGLPRISKELNQAKRAVVTQIDAFLSEIENTRSTVTNIIEAIDRMLMTALKK